MELVDQEGGVIADIGGGTPWLQDGRPRPSPVELPPTGGTTIGELDGERFKLNVES